MGDKFYESRIFAQIYAPDGFDTNFYLLRCFYKMFIFFYKNGELELWHKKGSADRASLAVATVLDVEWAWPVVARPPEPHSLRDLTHFSTLSFQVKKFLIKI